MLQSVLIISSSGLVIFHQHFSAYAVERMIGALLRTILELASVTTGGHLTYVESTASSIYITTHAELPIYCALFYEREANKRVGLELGRVLASRILSAFVDEYAGDLSGAVYGHALSHFASFGYRLPAIVRDTLKATLQQRKLLEGARYSQSVPWCTSVGVIRSLRQRHRALVHVQCQQRKG